MGIRNELVRALLEAGLITQEVAEILDRQLDPLQAQLWAERLLLQSFTRALNAQRGRVVNLIDPDNPLPPPDAFWDEEDERLWQAVEADMLIVGADFAVGSALQIGLDPDEAFNFANDTFTNWMRTRYTSRDLAAVGSVPNLNLTSRRRVASAITDWQAGLLGDPERPRGLPDLVEELSRSFGPVRGEAIAVTEVTRIGARSVEFQGELNPNVEGFVWFTSADERVCETCGPMHLQFARKGEPFIHPVLGEVYIPAHVRCRCGKRAETAALQTIPLPPEETWTYTGPPADPVTSPEQIEEPVPPTI